MDSKNKCTHCGEEIKPNCNWRQGRCPHLPSMLDQILADPYKSRYLNLFKSIKNLFKKG